MHRVSCLSALTHLADSYSLIFNDLPEMSCLNKACMPLFCGKCIPSPGREKLQVLMDEWMSCGGKWKQSAFYKRCTDRTTHSERGARVWMTRQQISNKYQSDDVANRICQQKIDDPELYRTQTKSHSDCDLEDSLLDLLGGRVFGTILCLLRMGHILKPTSALLFQICYKHNLLNNALFSLHDF